MDIHGVHHLAIQVRALDAMVAFYQDVLRFPVQARHFRPDGSLRSVWVTVPGGAFLALEDCDGEVKVDSFRRPDPGLHLLAFRISRPDRERWMAHFAAHSVAIVHQTRFSFYVRDPEGNRLAFSHHPEDASAS
jgi:glyoxylase I family protein